MKYYKLVIKVFIYLLDAFIPYITTQTKAVDLFSY